MPHYFVDVQKGDDRFFDDVGCTATDECEVLSALIEVLREYRRTPVYHGMLSQCSLSIIDTAGRTVVRLEL